MEYKQTDKMGHNNGVNISVLKVLQFTVLLSIILYFGRTVFIPLSIALLFSFLLFPICSMLEKKGLNKSLAIAISLFGMTMLLAGICYILFLQVAGFAHEWQLIKTKLLDKLSGLESYIVLNFNYSKEQQATWLSNFADSSSAQLFPFLKTTFYSMSVTLVLIIIIPVLSFLILYHRHLLITVLYELFPLSKKEDIKLVMREVVHTYYSFIKGMLTVYLIVGVLNSIGLAIVGVPHPILFGFTASILTFIPYVGIIVGSLLPISISWIEYNTIWHPLGVVFVFALVQYLEANIIFPVAVSRKLKINSLITILTIIAGGILWGAAGMILFIPFLGIAKLIADKTESLKIVSILLGDSESAKKPDN
ncbi:MAG: AI-2E family transporter [Bacteroidetes bacterium]|nr:AI-2E family transporter [Bacteroidota bacterium]